MIRPIAVGGQRSAEIRLREERHLLGETDFSHRIMKRFDGPTHIREQTRLFVHLSIMLIKATRGNKENLPRHAEALPH